MSNKIKKMKNVTPEIMCGIFGGLDEVGKRLNVVWNKRNSDSSLMYKIVSSYLDAEKSEFVNESAPRSECVYCDIKYLDPRTGLRFIVPCSDSEFHNGTVSIIIVDYSNVNKPTGDQY